jgi:hypothetical protein
MPLSLIFSLIGPVIVSTLTSIVQRLWKHGVTTAQGTAAGAGVIGFLEASGCSLSGLQEGVLGLIAAAPGLIATDSGKPDQPVWQAAFDKIKAARANVPTPPPPAV